MNLRISAPALLVTAALVAAACSGGDDAAPETVPVTTVAPATTSTTTTTTTTTTSTTTTTTELVAEETARLPLTGEPVSDEADIPDRPALAVKLDNHPRSRPQAGLNEADIVFEENVENLTRFAAVFHSRDSDPLGPIRSGRSQDVGILSPFDRPLFAWSGGNAGVRALIRSSELIDLDAGFTSGYYRRSGRGGAPHNLYSSTQALWENAPDDASVPPEVFPFLRSGDPLDGEPGTVVSVPMDGVRVRWEYDGVTGRYLRFQNDAAHETELTGQVSADNVIVMGVRYVRSQVDASSPEAQTTGEGPVLVFSRGVARVGWWHRESIFDAWRLTVERPSETDDDAELTDIGLVPGRTWVELARDAENFVVWE